MHLTINLATRPFVELRPLFARLRIAIAALVLLAIGLAVWAHMLSLKAKDAESRMLALQNRTVAFQTERQTNERRMQQPANRAVLERSQFLNGLFDRKAFSWTAVMMDLERVLPAGVQVTSIEPAITPDGEVTIRLRVSGERERAVELVRNLERSQRFLNPRLANESAQSQESNGRAVPVAQTGPPAVEFDILSGYNPLPAVAGPALTAKKPATPKTAAPNTSAPKSRPATRTPAAGGAR
jgi:type IV pilus assembly protein PilN